MSRSLLCTLLVGSAFLLGSCWDGPAPVTPAAESASAQVESVPTEGPSLADRAVDAVLIEEEESSPEPIKLLKRKSMVKKIKKQRVKPKLKGIRRARLGQPEVKLASLSTRQIKSIITERTPQVGACYERELKKNPSLHGKVLLAWTIRTDGSVTAPRARKNTTGSRLLAPCIIKAVSKWRFPKSNFSSDVEFPFVFKSKDAWR